MRLQRTLLRISLSLLFAWVAIPLVTITAALAQTAGVSITLDKTTYTVGQKGSLRINLPANFRDTWGDYSFVRIRKAGSTGEGQWLRNCGWPLANAVDRPCDWNAPGTPGDYEMYFTGARTGSIDRVFATTRFRVVAGTAGIPAAPAPASGQMRLLTSKPSYVFGERILVEITMPPLRAGDPKNSSLSWSRGAPTRAEVAKAAEISDAKGADVSHTLKGGKFIVPVFAPYMQDGQFELRLFHGDRLVDAIPLTVARSNAMNVVTGVKAVYEPGATMEFSVILPDNRYYHAGNGGASLALVPIELEGQRLTAQERSEGVGSSHWTQGSPCRSACFAYLEEAAVVPTTPAQPPWNMKTGTYTERLPAPLTPGRYQLRVTDRPRFAHQEWQDFVIAAPVEFVVEASGPMLRFVRADGSVVAGRGATIAHGEQFYLEAVFSTPPQDCAKTVSLDAGAGGVRQIPLVRSETDPRSCRSKLIRFDKPGS